MKDRLIILQAKYIRRALQLPEYTLLQKLLPNIQTSASHYQWYKLVSNPLWQKCEPVLDRLDRCTFHTLKREFLQDSYDILCNDPNSQIISNCRPTLVVDPVLWLPMTRIEPSQVHRWRLCWLPGGKPRPCPFHPTTNLSRAHVTNYLQIHRRLQLPESIQDPLSFLLDLLPRKKPTNAQYSASSAVLWPALDPIRIRSYFPQ
ncbi:hypothetical protein [Parasitella parasitica]|uniref:Uncharacterized protein n=1 Tax=Parasitella parasitica TaxID=35722 RepID=A0A0B7NGC2_9FUNG|nr:hypothetical protein [Parasitella parasitica]